MAFLISFIFLSSFLSVVVSLPYNTYVKGSRVDFESSGGGPNEPVQGVVKVVKLDPRTFTQSGIFRRGLSPRRAPIPGSRASLPAFLSLGRPGPSQSMVPKTPVTQHNLQPKNINEMQKKRIGLQMWQRAINRGAKKTMSLPVNLKDTKQSCTAVPFTQHVTADGCDSVTVHNKLCFGQCSSLFVPSEGEFAGSVPAMGAFQRRAPCSRCAPFKAQTVTVPLRCGAEVRLKQVMLVEECKCETGREERNTEAPGNTHL